MTSKVWQHREEYFTWRLEKSGRRLLCLLPVFGLGIAMMMLHCLDGLVSTTGCCATSCLLVAQGILVAKSLSTSRKYQLLLWILQELSLTFSALQIGSEWPKQHFYMATVMPSFLIFSSMSSVPLGPFLTIACPVHLGCWLYLHGQWSHQLVAMGLIHCFGAALLHLLVEEVDRENFHVLSKLLLEQEYMETMHCSLQGMLSSVFDASCICNEEGDVRCWSQPRKDEALPALTKLQSLTLDSTERESLCDFLQRCKPTEVQTLTLKLKRSCEAQLKGIKVPARRGQGALEEVRLLVGLKLVPHERSTSKGSSSRWRRGSKEDRASISAPNRASDPVQAAVEQVQRLTDETARGSSKSQSSDLPGQVAEPTDTECHADDEGRRIPPRPDLQRQGSRLQQRAKGNGFRLKMDCNKVVQETTESFVDVNDLYELLEQLGRGSISNVRKAVRKKDGLLVCLKIAGKDKSALVEAEFKILKSIKHPHIVQAFDYLETAASSILVLEYVEGSTLEEAVAQWPESRLNELNARELFRGLMSALCHLHSQGIIHRDVKPSNIMVTVGLEDLRLLDFNVAKRLSEGGALTTTGTRLYFAPEVIGGEPPAEANDVWGAGICLFYMLSGRLPWKNLPEKAFVEHPALKLAGSWCQHLSEPCKSVIRQCLTVECNWRPPVRAIILHEWFWSDDSQEPLSQRARSNTM